MEIIQKYWALLLGALLTWLAFLFQISSFFALGVLFLIIFFISFPVKAIIKYNEKHDKHYYPSFTIAVIICSLVYAALTVLTAGFINEWDFTVGDVVCLVIISLLFSGLYGYLYFLPYLIANKKHHLQTRAIYILNLFAGWTFLAWIIALIWANTEPKPQTVIQQTTMQSDADELRKYKDLLDTGVISQEKYDAKKRQILGF